MGIPQLPHEITRLILSPLTRRDLWALCLVCREWNTTISLFLYETAIIVLPVGALLAPPFLRSFMFNPDHSKIHLIENLCFVSRFDQIRRLDNTNHNEESECKTEITAMINEILHSFLRKLSVKQLRSFVWRLCIDMSEEFFAHLAEYQSSLECLYICKVREGHKLAQNPVFRKLSSLRSFRWGDLRSAEDMQVFIRIIRASGTSLQSLGVAIDPAIIPSGRDEAYAIQRLLDGLSSVRELKLPSLLEYQTPISPIMLKHALPFSRIRRIYGTSDLPCQHDMQELLSFNGLAELVISYQRQLPLNIEAVIHRHGATLRILSLCSAPRELLDPEILTAEQLLELGRRCPNLVELAVSLPYRNARGNTHHITRFPNHVFPSLEFLLVSLVGGANVPIPFSERNSKNKIARDRCLSRARRFLGRMLSQNNPDYLRSNAPGDIMKLKILALGDGKPEIRGCMENDLDHDPHLWSIEQLVANNYVRLNSISLESTIARYPNWKLLRRYPLLVPNEGMRHIFQNPHLPPYRKGV
ncbi:hypothetical protein TWF281_010201 [Arthrobotrys megalospora]